MRKEPEVAEVTLQPGELHVARRPSILQTILGSCIGVTFWNERVGAGALCHGVLPRCPKEWPEGADASFGHRYVDFSIQFLARTFDALGVPRQEVEVKVFGGSDVLPVLEARSNRPTVGALNTETALAILGEEGLSVRAYDLGGTRGRKIHFHTGTGEVLVYRLNGWSDPL